MNSFSIQLLTLVILLLFNFLAGFIPLIVVRAVARLSGNEHGTSQKNRILSFFLHMGGGVFMSICLLILMPDSRGQFETHEKMQHLDHTRDAGSEGSNDEHGEEFPIPEFVILCGFFATFALEEILHYILYHCRSRKDTIPNRRVKFCTCAKRHTECSRAFKAAENPEVQTMFGLQKSHEASEKFPGTNLLHSSIISQPIPNYGTVMTLSESTTPNPVPPVVITNNGSVTIIKRLRDFSSPVTTSTSNILLVITLSLYAISEGTTIGLLTHSSPWTTLLVACLQQSIVVFVIGWVGMSQSEQFRPILFYVVILSLMSPFGISLSMFVGQNLSRVSPIVCGVAKALVCGALLYLTFCDFMRRRKLKESPHIERFAGFTLGASTMAALQYISLTL